LFFLEILADTDKDDEDEDVLINVNIADNEVAKERVDLGKKKTPGYRAYNDDQSADEFGMVCDCSSRVSLLHDNRSLCFLAQSKQHVGTIR
jgi:hypothetical protein